LKRKISNKIFKYYQNLYEKYGYDSRSVGWGDKKGKQSLRFEILCQIGNFSNSSILDVGCGFGDFYEYLHYRKIRTNYHGVDINPNLIEIGKIVYPKISLEKRDIEKKKFRKKFDWVVASGITSHGSTYPHLNSILTEMYRISRKGFAINFVSDNVDYKIKGLFYTNPEKIISLIKKFSNRFILRHDYMPYEYTLYVYKNNKKTRNNIFYEFIKNSKIKFNDDKWLPKINISKL